MMLVVGMAFRVVRMGEAVRMGMRMCAGVSRAAGVVGVIMVVHGAGVPRVAGGVNHCVIA